MKKWIALLSVALLLLFGFVASGPYIAMHGIRQALINNDTTDLQRYVDLEQVRAHLRAQVEGHLARKAGDKADGKLALFALAIANRLADAGIDAAITPAGIEALLSGRNLWKIAVRETANGDSFGKPLPPDPLKNAKLAYVSASEFDATIEDENGRPVTFVFTREGLAWKLTNVQLSFEDAKPGSAQ